MRSVRNVSRRFNTFDVKRQCFVDVADYFFGSVRTAILGNVGAKCNVHDCCRKNSNARFYGGNLKLKMFENVGILCHCCSLETCTLVISLD